MSKLKKLTKKLPLRLRTLFVQHHTHTLKRKEVRNMKKLIKLLNRIIVLLILLLLNDDED